MSQNKLLDSDFGTTTNASTPGVGNDDFVRSNDDSQGESQVTPSNRHTNNCQVADDDKDEKRGGHVGRKRISLGPRNLIYLNFRKGTLQV